MRHSLMTSIFSAPTWAPDGVDGGGAGDAGDAKPAESVLFPNEGKPADGDKPADPPAGDKPADPPADWKEYENDPAKSAEENAAAKAEHDKAKPAADDADKAKLDTVPEDGKYTLTMPEGVELDTELADALSPEFKELGLTHAQANKLVGKYAETMKQRAEAHASQPEGQWSMSAYEYFKANGTPDKWADNAKADKDMGGGNWDATVAAATRATNALGTPELKAFLNASGGGNHPELIRFMAKVGAMIKEDNPASGGAEGKGEPVEPAHILFANDAPKG